MCMAFRRLLPKSLVVVVVVVVAVIVLVIMWTLCLTNPHHGRKIVQVDPTASLDVLYQVAEETYQQPVESLRYGFPPQSLPRQEQQHMLEESPTGGDVQEHKACIQTVLKNQERIQVEFKQASRSQRSTLLTTKTMAQPLSDPSLPSSSTKETTTLTAKVAAASTRRPQRAAAQRATENMPTVIRAQEELLGQQQQQQQQQKKKGSARSPSSKRPRTTAPTRTPSSSFAASSVGEGRRLADGAAVVVVAARRRSVHGTTTKQKSSSSSSSSPTDMSEALLGALNDTGTMGRVLRRGMKTAVLSSYETSKAFSRLSAIQAKTFTMTRLGDAGGEQQQQATTTTTSSSYLTVQYQGFVDNTKTTETVDCIPRTVLEEVLKGIHVSNPEALRPENLALLSPRVLWSLVYLFSTPTTPTTPTTTTTVPHSSRSVQDMYQELLPDLNWTFLRRRAPQLSEKALENLRQEQQQQQEDDDDEEDDGGEHALEAIAAVEHAMEHLHDYTANERKSRLALAAMNRWNNLNHPQGNDESTTTTTTATTADQGEWKLSTPTDPDEEELRECIQASDGTAVARVPTLIKKLMQECQIHNWRELANAPDAAGLAEIVGEPVESVHLWIDYAQGQSVDEVMVEICDGNVRAVELLTEKARSGTPKDLAVWRSIPQLLHQYVAGDEEAPTIDELQTWSHRAHTLLRDYEWLNWYATPVE